MNKELNKIAFEIIKMLPRDVIVHKYNSYSTNSIYLKFDYGLAHSLRISDHNGKKHLSYKYNLLLNQKDFEIKEANGYEMRFYSVDEIDKLINDILSDREKAINKYSNYIGLLNYKKNSIDYSKGFWCGAKEVSV